MNGNEFRGTVKKYMEMRGIDTFKELLRDKALGSFPTFKRKWDNPALFSIAEIDYLCKRLNIRSSDRLVLKGESDKVTTPFYNITEEGAFKNRA